MAPAWPRGSRRRFAAPHHEGLIATRDSRAFFVELVGEQGCERIDRGLGVGADGGDRHRGAGSGRQHHQSHDRVAADGLVAACHKHLGIEAFDHLDEFGRSTGVQAAFVDDEKFARDGAVRDAQPDFVFGLGLVAHLPASTRLAMVTYLRPASWAMAMASGSERSSRTLASLTSMGRLMPASTSTFGRLMQEIARLEGVPPNMSVRIATPSPLSTRFTASMMSLRHKSESSSAPIVTASICFCGPMTCSSAALNSSARRPWVTSTRPIIGNSSRVLFGAPHERATLTIQSPRARGVLAILPELGRWQGSRRRSIRSRYWSSYGYQFPSNNPKRIRSNLNSWLLSVLQQPGGAADTPPRWEYAVI